MISFIGIQISMNEIDDMPPLRPGDSKLSHGTFDFQNVLQLVELIKSSSNFSEIRVRSGDVEVELRRGGGAALDASPGAAPPAPRAPAAAPMAAAVTSAAPAPAPAPAVPTAATPAAPRVARDGETVVHAPMVGTVYRAPEPGAAPFVTLGQAVSAGDPLCIIEVMKLMNSIAAECDGVVSEILVTDAQAVLHGQPLFVITRR